jgi:hypothetical protein
MLSELKKWWISLGLGKTNSLEGNKVEDFEQASGKYGDRTLIVLERFKFSNQGTLGRLLDKDGGSFSGLVTLELPWKDNARSVSCIPRGSYKCSPVVSPRFGDCYQVDEVPGRSHILFHHGNFAGDRSLGMRTDSNGCILLGYKHSKLQGQDAVLSSRVARTLFESSLDNQSFVLEIRERI